MREVVPYFASFAVFMDIDDMRDLFGQNDDYFNVAFSDHELDIDGERLYQTSTRADVMKRANVFLELMQSMIIMMTSVGIFIFIVVLYQMMKVMIDRASNSIALMKVFGYREDEIRKLFLDANFAVVAVGAAVLIPICKWIMDQLFPSFVENVACGIDLSWAPWLYPVIYLGVIACYLVVRTMLMRAVRRSKPVDALSRNE